jgi:hypothetical protein
MDYLLGAAQLNSAKNKLQTMSVSSADEENLDSGMLD